KAAMVSSASLQPIGLGISRRNVPMSACKVLRSKGLPAARSTWFSGARDAGLEQREVDAAGTLRLGNALEARGAMGPGPHGAGRLLWRWLRWRRRGAMPPGAHLDRRGDRRVRSNERAEDVRAHQHGETRLTIVEVQLPCLPHDFDCGIVRG